MTILIADAGATKTSWKILSNDSVIDIGTSGLNPHLVSDFEIRNVLLKDLVPKIGDTDIGQIFFYGAGCKDEEQANRIKMQLIDIFPDAKSIVSNDIEGAGLALFHEKPGVVLISGTGSSAGMMSNGSLIDIMPSLPFPEGDLGSGSHIGSLILHDYLKDKAPDGIDEILSMSTSLKPKKRKSKTNVSNVLKEVASISSFSTHPEHEYLTEKASRSIEVFLEQLIYHFGPALLLNPIKIVGRTAEYFEPVFHKVFSDSGFEIVEVIRNPIEGLTKYHKNGP